MNRSILHYRLNLFLLVGILSLLWTCKSADKAENRANDLLALEQLSEQEEYRIDVKVAFPFNTLATTQVLNALLIQNAGNNPNRIDVAGNGNFIEIRKDSVKGYLPFFGERRINGGSYGANEAGIQFDGKLENYTKQVNEKKGKLVLEFSTEQIKNGSDSYDVIIEIYPNENTMVTVTPTYKTFMRYSGMLTAVDIVE
ncbi:DUF4251 domain-containing protein [Winogradskyella luteola]|uniref:DUF4251 domain-containing protein n=1 Tax=Winogradskyella luteola TaxID=2828330 RepID=A0A9X1F669_9FLAO|nr:DUF4251 domain-containing protein [Winogradskyella luteola]MBV7268111.1 DUF4251 domain-containing protein [Winogradskyella luteola]